MKNTLYHALLSRLKNKHTKLSSRFHKSVSEGDFQKQRYRKRKASIERLKNLEKRIHGLSQEAGVKASLNYKHWAVALALGAVVAMSNPVQAQVDLSDPVVLGSAKSTNILRGDLDGDGDMDAIYVSFVDDPLVLINEDGFSFSQIPLGNTAGLVTNTILADMDGDGDLDVFMQNGDEENGYTFQIWLNDGAGNFTSQPAIMPTVEFQDKLRLAGDIDGDGDLDFVGETSQNISPYYHYVTVFPNNSFDFSDTTALNGPYVFDPNTDLVHLMDADGDGDLDILYNAYRISQGNPLQAFRNNGSGGFTDSGEYSSISGFEYYASDTLDIDNDGDVDLILETGTYPASFQAILNDGSDNFTFSAANSFIFSDNNYIDAFHPFRSDVGTNNRLFVETEEDSTFVFNFAVGIGFIEQAKFPGGAIPADLDNDDDGDAFYIHNGNLSTLDNQGGGSFVSAGDILSVSEVFDVDTVDIDGDGNLDIVTAGPKQSRVWMNDGAGNFTPGQGLGPNGKSNAFGDLDGDGDMDMVRGLESQEYYGPLLGFEVWRNDAGTFVNLNTYDAGNYNALEVFIENIDGDADLEILVFARYEGDGTQNSLRSFDNDGGLAFTLIDNEYLKYEAGAIAIGDIDGDLNVDAIVSARIGYNSDTEIFVNDGSGNFAPPISIPTYIEPSSYNATTDVNLFDFDGDGDLDLLTNSETEHKLWRNDAGTFTYVASLDATGQIYQSFVGDIDGDGDVDIILGGDDEQAQNPKIYVNDGIGNFTGDTELNKIADGSTRLVIADLDGDGDRDVVMGGENTGLSVFFNLAEPEINVQGNGVDIVSGDATPVPADDTEFGTILIGNNAVNTFTIQNTAVTNLNISDITVGGTDAADFTIGGITPPDVVAGGGNLTFTVTFAPSASGLRSAEIQITNDDSDEGLYTFAIQGAGEAPQEINVQGNGLDIASGDVAPETGDGTDFDLVTLGENTAGTFTIQNTGDVDLNISDIQITGTDAADFVITDITPPTAIGGGTDATFTVTFTPGAAGARVATIEITSDDADEATYTFDITGTGLNPQEINVQGNGLDIASGDVAPETGDGTDFDVVTIGGNSIATFTIQNIGDVDLNVSDIQITGTDAADFVITDITPPTAIAGGTDATFTVTFTPGAVGARVASIEIISDDSDEATYTFSVTGTGVAASAPEINIQGNGLDIASGDVIPDITDGTDFGTFGLGEVITTTFTIQNTGNADLNITSVLLSGANASEFAVNNITTPAVVAGGGDITFDVIYSPTLLGIVMANVNIVSDDSDEGTYTFSISASAASPEINIQGNGLDIASGDVVPEAGDGTDFGTVIIGEVSTSTFTIQNTGVVDLNINSILLSGTGNGEYEISSDATPFIVAPDGSTTFDVTFTPGNSGIAEAFIDIVSDDSDEGTYTFSITGLAQTPQEINIQGNGIDIASGDNTTDLTDGTDFTSISLGQQATNQFSIQNIGEAPLEVTSIQLAGTNSADFEISGITLPVTVDGNSNATFDVTFTPSFIGPAVASIEIANDDYNADETTYIFDVAGTGKSPGVLLSDSLALVDLYNGTGGDSWTNNTNWLETGQRVDDWFGVTVVDGRVTSISLDNNNLDGPIPSVIGDLTELEVLSLTDNQLTGEFPTAILSLSILEELDLAGNNFSGDIPAGISNLTLLRILILGDNNLSGIVPAEISGLIGLTTVELQNNEFTDLPNLSGLTNLTSLNVSGNFFDFVDLEPNASVTGLIYSPQNTEILLSTTINGGFLSMDEEIVTRVNNQVSITVETGESINNQYDWRFNGSIDSEQTTIMYSIPTLGGSDVGTYELTVGNSLLPNLDLVSNQLDLFASAVISVEALNEATNLPIADGVNAYLFPLSQVGIADENVPDTVTFSGSEKAGLFEVSSSFDFPEVLLGDYLIAVESVEPFQNANGTQIVGAILPTFYGDELLSIDADILTLENDQEIAIVMEEFPDDIVPGVGLVDGNIEEDFGDDEARIDARRRAKKRKCGLRRRRTGGRTDQDDSDQFELIAYGETNDNGEFEYGFLPEGTYRFFVEYPGIPLNESAFVEFEIGEAGVSDDTFTLAVFASPDGIDIEIVLGLTSDYFVDFNIYPNPTTDLINIDYAEIKRDDVRMEIVNMDGKVLYTKELSRANNKIQYDTSLLNDGMYFIRFIGGGNEKPLVYKIIKK